VFPKIEPEEDSYGNNDGADTDEYSVLIKLSDKPKY
jgi:hypothetical protein